MAKELSWKDDGRFPIVTLIVGLVLCGSLVAFGSPKIPVETLEESIASKRYKERQEMSEWVEYISPEVIAKAKKKWMNKKILQEIESNSRAYANEFIDDNSNNKKVRENGQIYGYSSCINSIAHLTDAGIRECCSQVGGSYSKKGFLPTCRK